MKKSKIIYVAVLSSSLGKTYVYVGKNKDKAAARLFNHPDKLAANCGYLMVFVNGSHKSNNWLWS